MSLAGSNDATASQGVSGAVIEGMKVFLDLVIGPGYLVRWSCSLKQSLY